MAKVRIIHDHVEIDVVRVEPDDEIEILDEEDAEQSEADRLVERYHRYKDSSFSIRYVLGTMLRRRGLIGPNE